MLIYILTILIFIGIIATNNLRKLIMKELCQCPFCDGELLIKECQCKNCHSEIKGEFSTNRLQMFTPEQLYFIERFLVNEGNIKLMEKDLSISYPTVKNKLRQITGKLGYQTRRSQTEILKDLSDGKLTTEQALKELGGS